MKTTESKAKAKNTARDRDGRYDFNNMDLFCECGHRLGVHAGENGTKTRPCFNEDLGIEGATGETCNCQNFTKQA